MGDQSIRLAVDGISPPEKEKHQFFIDVQPVSKIQLILKSFEMINMNNDDKILMWLIPGNGNIIACSSPCTNQFGC